MFRKKDFAVFALPFLCLFFPATAEAQTAYTIQDLGPLYHLGAAVVGLNNRGEITARALTLPDGNGYIYSQGMLQSVITGSIGNLNDKGLTPLPDLLYYNGQANGQATLYDIHTGQSQIVGLPSNSGDSAEAVNQNGDAAGVTTIRFQSSQILNAALFRNGQTLNIGALTDGGKSYATALNNQDEVTGYGLTASGYNHAFLYTGGSMRDIGTLSGYSTSQGRSINASGQIVGVSIGATSSRAFLYQSGAMQDLGTLGGPSSNAFGINNAGVIVGAAQTQDGSTEPFVYSGGVMRNLLEMLPDAPDWTFGAAEAINDRGQIAGFAIHKGPMGNEMVLFLATPTAVPEPGVFALFTTGLLILGGWIRRRVRAT